MVRPRWQELKAKSSPNLWRRWSQGVALIATANLAWLLFDITYLPFRNFWLHRNLYPIPSMPLVVPLQWLPDITKFYDPIKGIEPHPQTEAYLRHFEKLDKTLSQESRNISTASQLKLEHILLTKKLILQQFFHLILI